MSNTRLRLIKNSEAGLLQKIAISTYKEAFDEFNTEENMKAYLSSCLSHQKLQSELENPNSEFYFAEWADQVIGYLKLNFKDAQNEFKTDDSLEIERIYVLEKFHGQKVGQTMFDYALKRAKEKDVNYVWLGVWENNPKAIRFYEKNGLEAFDQHSFRMGTDLQTDILMKLEFKA